MKITARDIEILKWAHEMKFLNAAVLTRQFFGKEAGTSKAASRRLKMLVDNRYLLSERSRPGSMEKFYYPTKKSYELMQTVDIKVPEPIRGMSLLKLEHDLVVSHLRVRLKSQYLSYLSEREIQASLAFKKCWVVFGVRDLPDGVLIEADGKKVALEYENTQKSEKRIIDKIYKYFEVIRGTHNEVDEVWVICKTRAIFKKYQKALDGMNIPVKVSVLDEVLGK